jgi:CTP synthase (UTP-ammonia lyase)
MEDRGMHVTGLGENEEARIVELSDHRFFLATAFQPHFSSEKGKPHPLISAFLEAASSLVNIRG